MSKELVISSNRHETKVAILEDDQLVEVYFQRADEYSLAGSIHKGRVTRVLPGMQSAFVDLGLERDTFLYVSDFFDENEESDDIDRVDRVDRVMPEERTARPPRQSGPPVQAERRPVEAALVAAVPEPAVVSAAPTIETPPREPRQEGGDRSGNRDNGRRSRRRRRGGRGFPDSKYASPGQEQEAEAADEGATDEPEAASTELDFPIVLPGESLAKYQGQARVSEPAEAKQSVRETKSNFSPVSEIASEPLATPIAEPEQVQAPAEPAHSFAEEAETPHPVALLPTPELEPIPHRAIAAEAAVTVDTPEELESHPVLMGDEAMVNLADIEIKLPSLEDVEDAPFFDDETIDGSESAETEETSEPLTASVRENTGRAPHRGSRRLRRRSRGGRGGEDREPRNPEAVAGVGAVVTPVEAAPVVVAAAPERERERPAARPERERPPLPSISELLKEGQEIIVQIAKEPLGQKGARITSHIALPGRYVVYMPTVEHHGVSRKIASDEERQRLKRILLTHRTGMPGGCIVRTAGEGRTEDEIAADMMFLYNLWMDIRQKAEKKPAPLLLHHDLDIVQRLLRDQVSDSFKTIWMDNEDMYETVLRFVQRFQPNLVTRVKMYTRPTPIFDTFNITAELEKALRPKVWLKSGGYIVINQTEALVAIDVNTGKYVGKSNRLEDTIVKTNTEAVKEIVRQVRLRDLGGIIVIDFIDMDERKNRQKVMQALEEAMEVDRAPYKILQFNDFGLVAITRKRVKQSLERTLCSPCPACEGAGYVKSVATVISDIMMEAQKIRKAVEGENVMLRVSPAVAKVLKSNDNKYLEELEEILGRPVMVKGDPLLQQEKYDLS